MILAGMITADEEALICDFAETYGIYDYRKLPLKTAAILASGLRDNSRIKIKLSGLNAAPEMILNAAIADRTGMLVWMQSKDGAKNRNRPASILDKILNPEKKKEDVTTFATGQDFEDEWNRLLGGEGS